MTITLELLRTGQMPDPPPGMNVFVTLQHKKTAELLRLAYRRTTTDKVRIWEVLDNDIRPHMHRTRKFIHENWREYLSFQSAWWGTRRRDHNIISVEVR